MDILEIENLFAKSSFFFLFLSMIFYWIQIAFVFKNWNYGKMIMICANFCLFSFLILRWDESGHFPLSNLYESLIFLSWSLSTFHLFLENVLEKMNTGAPKQNFQNFLGAITSPSALFTNSFAAFSLPTEMQRSAALVPALQSNWLMMHVTVMILSYSALICGSLLSIAFLIFTRNIDMDNNAQEEKEILENIPNFAAQNSLASPSGQPSFSIVDNSSMTLDNFSKQEPNSFNLNVKSFTPTKKEFLENLDNLSYRILGIGFPFLTIGILSGAVWANEAWGSYWSWDPKETWALATWLVFAIYLHTRLTKGWRGKKPAIIASFGFVIVWVCFLGVNLLGEGLHSYGFFKERF